MKKFILFSFAFASLAGALVSCSDEILDEPIVEPSGAEDDTEIISKEDLEKSLHSYAPLSLTAEESYISEKSVDFAWKLMSENSKLAGGKNTAISPLSASLALSMTATGAVGSTQQDILATLGYEVDIDKANQSAKKLALALTTRDEITNVILANSFWHQPSFTVKQNYKTDIANFYGSDIYAIDDKTFVADANEWCSKATRGLIKDFIKDGTQADWMILNATYFKGIWCNGYSFYADNTAPGVFKNTDGTSSRVEMMHRTGDYPYK